MLNLSINKAVDFSITLVNKKGEELVIGYNKSANKYFIDRTRAGKTDFQKDFGAIHYAPRFTNNSEIKISLIIDVSSVELFADDGLSVMTEIFFPNEPFDKIHLQSATGASIKKLEYIKLSSIWK